MAVANKLKKIQIPNGSGVTELSIGDVYKEEFADIGAPAASVNGCRNTLIAILNVLQNGEIPPVPPVDPPSTKLNSTVIAPNFDPSATYDTGETCTYDGVLYECVVAKTTASATTPNNDIYNETTAPTNHWKIKIVVDWLNLFSAAITALSQRGYVVNDNGQPIAVFPDGTVPELDGQPLRYSRPDAVALTATDDAATLALADRAVTNATIASGFSTLNLTFPPPISGKVRDFYMRITVAAGESAPAISLPSGITAETSDGALPEIADGDTSASSTTVVYFTENATNVFMVKSEVVKPISSAA